MSPSPLHTHSTTFRKGREGSLRGQPAAQQPQQIWGRAVPFPPTRITNLHRQCALFRVVILLESNMLGENSNLLKGTAQDRN